MRFFHVVLTVLALFATIFLMFAVEAHAQVVPAQNQVTTGPYGGVVLSTTTSPTGKLNQLLGSAFGQLLYWTGTRWDAIATSSLGLNSFWNANGSNIYNNNAGYVGIGSSTPSGHLGLSQGGADGDIGLLLDSPNADNLSTRYGIKLVPGTGPNTTYYGFYADVSGSVPWGLYLKNGNAFINGFLDMNGNSIRNAGNMSLKAIPNPSYGNLELWDYGGTYYQEHRGGILSFKGTTGTPETANATFASIRGIKENDNYLDSLGALVFYTQATTTANADITTVTEKMRITSGGNVGIGTTTPFERLTIAGNSYTSGTSTVGKLSIPGTSDGCATFLGGLLGSTGSACGSGGGSGNVSTSSPETFGFVPFWTSTNGNPATLAGTSSLFIASTTGNVGIGTTNPGKNLEIFESTNQPTLKLNNGVYDSSFRLDGYNTNIDASAYLFLNTGGGFGSGGGTLQIGNYTGLIELGGSYGFVSPKNLYAQMNQSIGFLTVGSSINYDAFRADYNSNNSVGLKIYSYLNTDGGLVERIRILDNGNVGIGTTTPPSKLTVSGNALISNGNLSLNGTNAWIQSTPVNWGTTGYLQFGTDADFTNDGNYFTSYVPSGKGFSWVEAGTPHMVVVPGGNVGIGTTTPGSVLTVAGTTTAPCFSTDGGATCLTSSSGGITSLNGLTGATQTFATGTATGIGLNISSVGTTHTFTPTVSFGYSIPLTASTTDWNTAYLNRIVSLTTNGNSNFATLSGNVLNIPAIVSTTTSNTWAGTQTFTNSPVFSTLGAGTVNSTSGGMLYNTATSTPSLALGLSYSGTLGSFVGGSSGTLSIATSSLYTGTTGQFAAFSGTNTLSGTSLLSFSGTTLSISTTTAGTLKTTSTGLLYVDTAGGATNYFTNSGDNTYLSTGTKLGVGSTTPFATFAVGTTTSTSPTLPLFAVSSSTQSTIFGVFGNGNVGIGSSSPIANLTISGTASTTGSVYRYSFWLDGLLNTTRYVWRRIDQYGHWITGGPVPTCGGSGSGTVTGNDTNGKCEGARGTSQTITFARPFPTGSTVICTATIMDDTNATIRITSTSVTSFSITSNTSLNAWMWHCEGVL